MKYSRIDKDAREYPDLLRQITKPPEELYCLGDVSLMKTRCVAVVGSRKLSDYGRRTAFSIGEKLGRAGITVVSGMARGADTCAHKGALSAGGKTIAVLGTDIETCYPVSNRSLKETIAGEGLVITEFPPGYPVKRENFPQRNRIISGLSEAVVIAEAGLSSGSLITAGLAADQGRSVYAVPANIDNPGAIGSNLLIRDGVMPLVIIDDILEDLGITRKEEITNIIEGLGEDERKIVLCLQEGGEMTTDYLCQRLEINPAKVNGIITVLEMKGLVHSSLGKIFLAK